MRRRPEEKGNCAKMPIWLPLCKGWGTREEGREGGAVGESAGLRRAPWLPGRKRGCPTYHQVQKLLEREQNGGSELRPPKAHTRGPKARPRGPCAPPASLLTSSPVGASEGAGSRQPGGWTTVGWIRSCRAVSSWVGSSRTWLGGRNGCGPTTPRSTGRLPSHPTSGAPCKPWRPGSLGWARV